MSECVVRMEMPKGCPCELAGGYDIPLPCFAGHGIPKRCKEFDECVEKGTKPDWCPFVCSLPEGHGRLVDVTKIDFVMFTNEDSTFRCGWNNGVRSVMQHAETIVPADTVERSET